MVFHDSDCRNDGLHGTSSIWPGTVTPAVPSDTDGQAIELGVKFRSTVDGYICGIRFYKGSLNTGTHVGTLWTSTGQALATATFSNESASGWQQVNFAAPVAISANTIYVASYHSSQYYALTERGFLSAGVSNGPLYAPATGESGGNGVYRYGASGFPSATVGGNNYWVDVVFTTSIGLDTTPPTVSSTLPATGATGVIPTNPVTVTFNEAMDATTIITSTFELRDSANALVPAAISYNVTNLTATLIPSSALIESKSYTATVKGGASGVKDLASNPLAIDRIWYFTTGVDPCSTEGNPIVCENSKIGNPASEWDVSGAGDASIQGYATDISVNRGETVKFKISTPSTGYRLDIYRMGYYAGNGARKVATVQPPPSVSLPQTQPPCLNHAATGLFDCGNWAESASWSVPADATSGIYFAKAVREDGANTGKASHIVFIVRDDTSTSDILFQTADTTWHAYNNYGGNSLYQGTGPGTGGGSDGRAYKVSYNRPFNTRAVDGGQDWLFNAEYPMVRWLEANGYNVSYFTGVDSDRRGNLIRNHKLFLSNGHDEYWSGQQRTNVENARDIGGVHLAFFSGNEVFWKTRWENSIDVTATPNRTMVCYKETHNFPKNRDPDTAWTGTWRDPRGTDILYLPKLKTDGGRPENALMGPIFTVNDGATTSITVPEADGKMRFWRNTTIANLTSGASTTLPFGTLGYEWDEDLDNGFRPAGLVRLSSTTVNGAPVLTDYGSTFGSGPANHALTLYRASSGALIFGAGTVQWAWGLDSNHDRGNEPADARMQQATVNLFADMGVQPGNLLSGLVAATASTDATRPRSTITSPGGGANVPLGSVITITGTATDDGGRVGGVEVSVDGGATWRAATGRAYWTYSWTTPSSSVTVNIKSRAVDDSLNLETPGSGIMVNVGSGSDTMPPTVAMIEPANGANVTGIAVAVSANASDNVAVASVQFLLDGAALGSPDTVAPYSITWDSTGTLNGLHTLSARASDTSGLTATANVSVRVSNAAPVAPNAPTALTGTAVSSNQINLSWTDNATNETGFKIERCQGQGAGCSSISTSFTQITTVGSNVVSYSDTALAASTSYSYRVRAYNGVGDSAYSNTVSATTQTAVTPTGLVAAYSFDEGTGTSVSDASGKGHTGAISGATWVTTGKFGNALNFNGSSNLVTVADANDLDLTTTMTLEAWVNPNVLSNWRTVILKERPSGLSYALYAHDTARPSAYINTGGSDVSADGSASLPVNTWSHVAATYDGVILRLYVNGSQVGSRSVTGTMVASTSPLRFGGNTVWGEYFSGLIDEVRIYNRALSADEIQADSNTPVGSPPPTDTTSPTVAMTAPANGATVSGTTVAVSANASDNVAVASVQFLLDGVALGLPDTVAPYSFTWDSTGTTNGAHTLNARASDAAGNTADATAVSVTVSNAAPVAPAAPTGLTGTVVSITQINLSWTDNATNETGFKIERCQGAGCSGFTQIATVGSNVTSYNDTGLAAGASYGYRVRAYNGVGDSDYSNTVSATTLVGPTNTGYLSPSANAPVTSGAGDNNGFQTTPTNAYANDNAFAVDTNSGTSTSTSCTDAGKDKHNFSNFNVNVPPGRTINGIEIRLNARVDRTSNAPAMCVQLSGDGGANWTAAKSTATLGTTKTTYILGGVADLWGQSWTVNNFTNTNFIVRIINVASSTARDFSLDWVAVQVTYQ